MHRDGLQVTPENLTVLAPHRALLSPHGSSVCRRRAPCKPSSVIGTSVSLRRIDRAYYQDRCDVHSDTSDDTYSLTRRAAKRSPQEPHTKPPARQAARRTRARSMYVGEPRTSPEGSHAEWRHFPSVGLRRSAAANRAASESDRSCDPPPGLTGKSDAPAPPPFQW